MPSIFLINAIHINQKINNIQLPLFPIQWSPIQKQWILGDHQKLISYFILSCTWKLIVTTIIISALILAVKNPNLVQIEHLFVCVACLLLILASFITDLILILYGEEIVGCCNWCYKAENDW